MEKPLKIIFATALLLVSNMIKNWITRGIKPRVFKKQYVHEIKKGDVHE